MNTSFPTRAVHTLVGIALLAFSGAAGATPIPVGVNYEGTWIQPGAGGGTVGMLIDTDVGGAITGHFNWLCTFGVSCSGEELFSGSLSSAGFLDVTGYALVNSVDLGLGHYWGDFSSDYRSISDGQLSFAGSSISIGSWSVAAVPEPATLALFALSLVGVGLTRRKLAR